MDLHLRQIDKMEYTTEFNIGRLQNDIWIIIYVLLKNIIAAIMFICDILWWYTVKNIIGLET